MSETVLRTPDERFAALPGFTFAPRYVEGLQGYEGLRLHYLDEGPPDAAVTFLCLHGQPTWSYLYRKMIPVFTARGHRVVAPDFFGFGRSDKPVEDAVYTFDFHRQSLLRFLAVMDLRNVCLVVQDWGGLLGLTLPMALPDRITRLIVMNTTLAIGKSPGEGFDNWKAFSARNPDMKIGALMGRAVEGLTPEEAAAYDAPYPDQRYKAGVRRFPELVMVSPDMEGVGTSKGARAFLSRDWTGESFMAVGVKDIVLGTDVMTETRGFIRNCPDPMKVDEGHFVQESGGPIAKAALDHFGL
ncbi:MAG: haloalkane dehalogenase [Alphaproteobacteria bacterium]